jgi:hypothetical protein
MKGERVRSDDRAQVHGLKSREVGRLGADRTVARDLARRAERAYLTLSDLDLGTAACGQRQRLTGVGRSSFGTMMLQILHQDQVELDQDRSPNYQLAMGSTSAEPSRQAYSPFLSFRIALRNRIAP